MKDSRGRMSVVMFKYNNRFVLQQTMDSFLIKIGVKDGYPYQNHRRRNGAGDGKI